MNKSIIYSNIIRRSIHMGRVVPEIDDKVRQTLESGDIHPKKLPTRRNLTRADLPVKLEFAAKKILQKHGSRPFRREVLATKSALYNYKLPDDKLSLQEKRSNIITEIQLRNLEEKHVPSANSDYIEDESVAKHQRKILIETKLERKRRDWHYLEYDENASALYMAARLAPNYAAVKTVMDEIKFLDEEFKPTTVLDFGSGMGTTMWAVNETWCDSTNEFLNVDISKSQNELAESLLRGGRETGPTLPGVFFRNYLPMSHLVRYDLVVASFALLDLPTLEHRINVIENLWHKTNNLLVIVERGTRDGFRCVAEARHFLLNLSGHNVAKKLHPCGELGPQLKVTKPSCHILAPCPHEYVCPRLHMSNKQSHDICNFRIKYEPLEFGMRRGMIEREDFSYTIVKKGPHPSYFVHNENKPRWPRIVEPRKKGTKHVAHKLCCPNGHMAEITCTRRRHGSAMYDVAKSSDWGDTLPITVNDEYVKKSQISPSSEDQQAFI